MLDLCRRRWARIGAALGVDRPHCVSHIAGCEDNKTVAQLIEAKEYLARYKNGFHHIKILAINFYGYAAGGTSPVFCLHKTRLF